MYRHGIDISIARETEKFLFNNAFEDKKTKELRLKRKAYLYIESEHSIIYK